MVLLQSLRPTTLQLAHIVRQRSAVIVPKATSSTCCPHSKNKKQEEPATSSAAFWSDSVAWQRARVNTLRCLIGCTAGDFSTMWYLQLHYPQIPPVLSTMAAMVAGISTSLALETVLLRRSLGVSYRDAFKTAMGMSFASMLAMELAENVVDWHLMGGQVVFNDPKFWMAAGVSSGAGYLVPLPYNYWRLKALGKSCH